MAIGVEKQRNTSWLISYGDTVTLLICLLITIVVVLQGQSEKDIEWVAEQVQIISDNFRKDYPDLEHRLSMGLAKELSKRLRIANRIITEHKT